MRYLSLDSIQILPDLVSYLSLDYIQILPDLVTKSGHSPSPGIRPPPGNFCGEQLAQFGLCSHVLELSCGAKEKSNWNPGQVEI